MPLHGTGLYPLASINAPTIVATAMIASTATKIKKLRALRLNSNDRHAKLIRILGEREDAALAELVVLLAGVGQGDLVKLAAKYRGFDADIGDRRLCWA